MKECERLLSDGQVKLISRDGAEDIRIMSHSSDQVITIYWLSKESEPLTLSWNPLHGWYRLKRRLLECIPHLQIHNALNISLFRLQGDDLVVCRSEIITSGVYYAMILPRLQERLDYIYPMDDASLWRWTYPSQGRTATLSFLEQAGHFCRLQEFRQAKQEGKAVPWYPTIEAFVSSVSQEIEGAVPSHLLLHWHHRR